MLLIFSVAFSGAEVGAENASSTRRRPKSIPRVYDQRPVVVNMDEAFFRSMPRQREEIESNLSPEAMRDNRPRSFGGGNPALNNISFVPMLPQQAVTETEEDRERPSSWLSPMDFLDEEDLFGRDGNPDDLNGGREEGDPVIFDWEGLGEQLSERELREGEAGEGDSASNENGEDDRPAIRSVRDRDMRSMALEPVQMGAITPEISNEDRTNRTQRDNQNNRQTTDGSIASRMESAMRMGGPPPRAQREEDDDLPQINLTGTRSVMEESTSRWNAPAASSSASGSGFRDPVGSRSSGPAPGQTSGQVSRPAMSAGWNSPPPERVETLRPTANPPSVGSSIRMEPMRPTSSMPSVQNRPSRETAPAQRETIDRSHFREDEFRLRPRANRF